MSTHTSSTNATLSHRDHEVRGRESGGDRSAVTGGTRVLSDWIKVRITAEQGSTFLDRMIALVPARR
jgi:high-affinity K+ transport system ATPase subunit B